MGTVDTLGNEVFRMSLSTGLQTFFGMKVKTVCETLSSNTAEVPLDPANARIPEYKNQCLCSSRGKITSEIKF